MRRAAALLPLVLLAGLAACTSGREREAAAGKTLGSAPPPSVAQADPSAVIAADIALAGVARDKDLWSAYRQTAGPGAVLFVPQPVDAPAWLKRRPADPQAGVRRKVHAAWMSCDGSLALTTGGWRDPRGANGWYVTAWQRQTDGSWRWTLNETGRLGAALATPEVIVASIASCEPPPAGSVGAVPVIGLWRGGNSADGTLYWSVRVDPQCGRIVTVRTNGGAIKGFDEVVNRRIDPPRPGAACLS